MRKTEKAYKCFRNEVYIVMPQILELFEIKMDLDAKIFKNIEEEYKNILILRVEYSFAFLRVVKTLK